MNYWKYIDIDPDELTLLRAKVKLFESTFASLSFQQPLDLGLTHFLNRPVAYFILVQIQPQTTISIHSDERPNNLSLAVNIPLENCDNTTTSFYVYDSDRPPEIKHTVDNKQFKRYNPDYCRKVSEYQLTSPVILRTDVLHNVVNNNNTIRRAISVRFVEDPWDLIDG